jgi:acetaldehyde dehydrogenase
MTGTGALGAAVIGSGNIGTDLMIKLLHARGPLRMRAMAGIDPASDGLARAARLGVATTSDGVEGLLALPGYGGRRPRPRQPAGAIWWRP